MAGKTGGYFIEAGAVDGRMLSTTWALETGYGWKGLLVEAREAELAPMRIRRPGSACVHAALGAADGGFLHMEADSSDVTGMMAVGTASQSQGVAGTHSDSTILSQGTAPIRTLASVLDEVGAPSRIDFMTLDVEGAELEVLQSFPFDRYSFGAMTIEHNFEEPRRSQIRGILANHGYVFAGPIYLDDIYMSPDVAARALLMAHEGTRRRRERGRRVAFGGSDLG